jgi:hypothetical protein
MPHNIFISYSHKDKPIADAICTNLEIAGFRCWIAPRDIAPGLDWPTAISNAISASRVMVLVFSANSNSSNDVSRELILAANSNLIIIPFKIDNISPEPGKQYYLARTHWLDAMNPPTQEQIDKLVGYAKSFMTERGTTGTAQHALADKPPSDESVPLVSTEPLPAKKGHTGRWIAGALVLIVLCGVTGTLLWNQRANLPLLPGLFATPTPTVTLTPSPTFTPFIPTLTPTLTATPDLRRLNPDNQHLYLFVETPKPYHQARDTCASWGGHLATIQDYNENLFVYRLTSGATCCTRLGATDEVVEGTWVWENGEPWQFTYWSQGQPDNGEGTGEDYLQFTWRFDLYMPFTWNDGQWESVYFVCEWETASP